MPIKKVVYVSIPAVLQSMIFSYLTVVLSTVEKQFGLKSKEAAWIYSGNEISQICFAVFIPFVGRLRKRPLVMGAASCLASFGILIIATPHFAGRGSAVIQGERGHEKRQCPTLAKNSFMESTKSQIDH